MKYSILHKLDIVYLCDIASNISFVYMFLWTLRFQHISYEI